VGVSLSGSALSNLYVPTNMPALDDLWDAFDFGREPNLQRYIDVSGHAGK
jgi:hypothetical protein